MAGSLIHAAGGRIRDVGSGNLRPKLLGYDDVLSQTLVPIVMSSTSSIEKNRLANFTSQAIKIRLETTAINETMRVNHIHIFVKTIYTDHPA